MGKHVQPESNMVLRSVYRFGRTLDAHKAIKSGGRPPR
jgi:hypothetical protein